MALVNNNSFFTKRISSAKLYNYKRNWRIIIYGKAYHHMDLAR